MKKSLTAALAAAGLLACGVAAHAQTTYYYSTQTYPSYAYTQTYPSYSYSYTVPVQPAVVATAPSYGYSYSYGPAYSYNYVYTRPYQAPSVVPDTPYEGSSASVTSDVPTRAGEATTMTNGVPNLLAQNWGYDGRPYSYYYYTPGYSPSYAPN